LAVLAAATFVAGCAHAPLGQPVTRAAAGFKTASVPSNFLWGVSTAGYQWEGQDETSQWARWDKAGKTPERNPLGADGYRRYVEDADLTKGLGCNTFRTSLEWSRIEPQEGVYDQAAIAHYHDLLDTLQARGLTPVITLMHFSYPAWMDADGGWESPKAPARFAKFAAFVAKEYGSQIKFYLTFNEPNVYLMGGYLAGMMPPGRQDPLGGLRALKNMVAGHKLAYQAVHANDPEAMVSFNMYTAEYATGFFGAEAAPNGTPEQQAKQRITSDLFFMDQVVGDPAQGRKGTLDYASFDYYCKFKISLPFVFPRADTWEVYPEGFYKALHRYHDRYHLPVLVAENGMATWDLAPRADRWTRSAYTVAHVKQMQRAMAEGVPVLGYVHWSITDNYEWGSFSPRFGLFSVDCRHQDFTRRAGDGVQAFKSIIAEGGVTDALTRRYPAPGLVPLPAPWEPGGGSAVHTY
jgi:beta-glucosidase